MKKLTFIILFIILLSFPVSAKSYVYDSAGVLDGSHNFLCERIKRDYGLSVYIVTDDESFNADNSLSTVGQNNAGPTIVFLINTEGYNDCRLYNGNRFLTRDMFSYDISVPYGNYDGSVNRFLSSAEAVAKKYSETTLPDNTATVALILGVIASFIAAAAFAAIYVKRLRGQLKSLHGSVNATHYMNENKTRYAYLRRPEERDFWE